MTNPFYHPLNQQPVQEAVTVEMEFKTDADGAILEYYVLPVQLPGS